MVLPDDPLQAARDLAKEHRLFIVDVHEKVVRDGATHWVPAWVVYRRLPGDSKARLGRRQDPAALYHFVRQCIGDTVSHP